jgi:hypothetical protein
MIEEAVEEDGETEILRRLRAFVSLELETCEDPYIYGSNEKAIKEVALTLSVGFKLRKLERELNDD